MQARWLYRVAENSETREALLLEGWEPFSVTVHMGPAWVTTLGHEGPDVAIFNWHFRRLLPA
jgi:hypothetical protein